MPTALNFTITNAGLAAAVAASGDGLQLGITHCALGTGQYTPTGGETALVNRKEKVTIPSGTVTGTGGFNVTVAFSAWAGVPNPYNATEIGFYAGDPDAGGVLFAVYSHPSSVLVVRNALDYVAQFALQLSRVPAGSVTIVLDPEASLAAYLIGQHLAAANPHAQYELIANRGAANGYTPLGADSKVPALYLPSYVDDVVEYATVAAFPGAGEAGKIYVATGTNKQYRWSGSAYVQISASPGTTDDVVEGAGNLYFTAQRVRDVVLTGLSLLSSAVPSALDSILTALGKLIKWRTDHPTDAAGHAVAVAGVSNGFMSAAQATVVANAARLDAANTFSKATYGAGVPLGAGTNLDLSAGDFFYKIITANTNLTISNAPPADVVVVIEMELTNAGAFTVGYWATFKWPNGQPPPALSVAGRDRLILTRKNGVWDAEYKLDVK